VAVGGSVFQLLVEVAQKANMLDAPDNKGRTLLFHASEKGNVLLVEELCKRGANVDITDHFGWTPLRVAVREGNISITKHLLNYSPFFRRVKSNGPLIPGDEISSAQRPSCHLLQIAIIYHSSQSVLPELVHALLDAGVDPNERSQRLAPSISSWNRRNDSDDLITPVQALFRYLKYGGVSELCKTLQLFVERGADVSGMVDEMSVEDVAKFEGFEDLWEILRSSNKSAAD
jgi:hypothetical protein